jgi:hypothetical protein
MNPTTPEPMSDAHLAEVAARLDAATEGPWWADDSDNCWRLFGVWHRIPPQLGGKIPEQVVKKQILKAPKHGTPYAEYWPADADADFIVNAPSDIRALLAEVRRNRAVLERVRQVRESWQEAGERAQSARNRKLDGRKVSGSFGENAWATAYRELGKQIDDALRGHEESQ